MPSEARTGSGSGRHGGDPVYQATRVQRLCHEADLWCFNLWHTDQEAYMEELIGADSGSSSRASSCPFDASWLGREIDHCTFDELRKATQKYQITLTGEGGVWTFVIDALLLPADRDRGGITVYRNYNGVLRIERAGLVEK